MDTMDKMDAAAEGKTGAIDSLAYFAAHAPEIPKWFERKEWVEEKAVPVDGWSGRLRIANIQKQETEMQYLCRWRLEFAKAMVSSLAND